MAVLISAPTLAHWLDTDNVPIVLDARARLADSQAGQQLWQTSRIPGARHIDMDRDLATPSTVSGGRHPLPEPADFAARLRALGITPKRSVVVYDDRGGRLAASRAWWMLCWAGHPDVRVLDGGWQAWQAAGLPVTSGPATPPPPSDWQPEFDSGLIADADDVARGQALVLDARAPARYRGDEEPMDPKAGHIPGACNIPADSLLDAQQQLLAPPTLHERLPAAQASIAYCGSGVTACHLILAHVVAGRPMPRLYPGSWSAWCQDPKRPIATGP